MTEYLIGDLQLQQADGKRCGENPGVAIEMQQRVKSSGSAPESGTEYAGILSEWNSQV